MPVENFNKYTALANILNSSFGKSGTKPLTTQSVKAQLLDDNNLKINFMMIVNFSSENMRFEMSKRYRTEGLAMIKAKLDSIKEEYKEATDSSVSFKIVEQSVLDSFELLTNSQFSPKKTAYYRLSAHVEVK